MGLLLAAIHINRDVMALPSALLDCLRISEEDTAEFSENNPGLCGVDMSRVSKLLVAQLSSARKHR